MKTATRKTESAALLKARAILKRDDDKRTRERETYAATERARIAKWRRTTFCRVSFDVLEMFKWTPRELSSSATLGELSDVMRPDLSECYFGQYARDAVRDEMDDARETIAGLYPDVPCRMLSDGDIADDLRRAMCSAAENDLEVQAWEWLRGEVDDKAGDVGALWVGLDDKGEPSTCPAEWASLSFAVSRRAFLDRGRAAWWSTPGERWWDNWTDYASNRERLDAADDIMSEHVADNLRGRINLEHFDERGSRWGDPELWPLYFLDYGSDAADTLERAIVKMRQTLRAMMKSRAPLETRAALVATVYGVPGSLTHNEGDDA